MSYIIESKVLSLAQKVSTLRAPKTIILQNCDVETASEDTIAVVAKDKGPISASYCAASNSNMANYRNQTGTLGINMHYFSKDETSTEVNSIYLNSHGRFPRVKKLALCCV